MIQILPDDKETLADAVKDAVKQSQIPIKDIDKNNLLGLLADDDGIFRLIVPSRTDYVKTDFIEDYSEFYLIFGAKIADVGPLGSIKFHRPNFVSSSVEYEEKFIPIYKVKK